MIIPTENDSGVWYGNEYLQLYKRMDEGVNNQTGKSGYAVYDAGINSGTWVEKYLKETKMAKVPVFTAFILITM